MFILESSFRAISLMITVFVAVGLTAQGSRLSLQQELYELTVVDKALQPTQRQQWPGCETAAQCIRGSCIVIVIHPSALSVISLQKSLEERKLKAKAEEIAKRKGRKGTLNQF